MVERLFLAVGCFVWVLLAGTFYGIWEAGVSLGGWVELRVGERREGLGRGGISAISILTNQRRRGQWEFNSPFNSLSWRCLLFNWFRIAGHDYSSGLKI